MGTLTYRCMYCGKKVSSSREASLDCDMDSHVICSSCEAKARRELEKQIEEYRKANGR